MNYRIKYKINYQKNRGFSLIEIIIVLAILGMVTGVSSLVYNNFQAENKLNTATSSIVESLRYAQSKSQAVSLDSIWRVKIYSDKLEIFKGNSLSETNNLPNGIEVSGQTEINFEKLTGKTNDFGTIIVSNNYGVKNITINEQGTINY